jgi:exodeoxyribonuclease-5
MPHEDFDDSEFYETADMHELTGIPRKQEVPQLPALNEDQAKAVASMLDFVKRREDDFFMLEGPAGTGKTFCIKELLKHLKGRLVFTAPTNKATKVLRESVTSDDYKPDCRTIYSLLGLRLEPNGEIKELTIPEDPLDLSKFSAVIVDEASMIPQRLWKYIKETAESQAVQFIFMGDPAQLPPVGELCSPVWGIDNKVQLTRVMRHDNQILKLATAIRGKVDHPAPSIQLASDNDGLEGVWVMSAGPFLARIREYARLGHFSKPNFAKAIAWRNVTVDYLNKLIRAELFDETDGKWAVGDRIIMLEPAKNLENDPIAHTDDEGTVQRVNVTWHPKHGQFKCYALTVCFDDNRTETIWLIHEDSQLDFNREVERLAAEGRAKVSGGWKRFWGFKESFHAARHAYAITAHRSQGSTYQIAFVDYRDILINRNRQEAFRCFYVGSTRPKKELYLA